MRLILFLCHGRSKWYVKSVGTEWFIFTWNMCLGILCWLLLGRRGVWGTWCMLFLNSFCRLMDLSTILINGGRGGRLWTGLIIWFRRIIRVVQVILFDSHVFWCLWIHVYVLNCVVFMNEWLFYIHVFMCSCRMRHWLFYQPLNVLLERNLLSPCCMNFMSLLAIWQQTNFPWGFMITLSGIHAKVFNYDCICCYVETIDIVENCEQIWCT